LVERDGTRVRLYLVILLLTGSIVPIAACQMLFALSGSYMHRLVWEGTSPDGRYHLEIRTRVNFPAYDLLGPESTAYFRLIDWRNGQRVATAET
jgi:hypothetical protein